MSRVSTVLFGFLSTFLLTRIRLHTVHAPLALGLLLASQIAGFDPGGFIGGIAIGAFFGHTPLWQELTASVAFGLLTWAFPKMGKPLRSTVRFLMFSVIGVLTLPLHALKGEREILYGVISLALALLSSFVFRKLLKTILTFRTDRVLTDREQIAAAAAIGCVLISVSDIQVFGWSLTVMLLVTLTAAAVTVRGIYGTAASVLWASMIVLYRQGDPTLIGSVAAAALLAAPLRSRGKPFVIVSYFLSAILFDTIAAENVLAMNAQNLIFGVLFYFLIPQIWLNNLNRIVDGAQSAEQTQRKTIRRIERIASDEIDRMGKLMLGLSDVFRMETQDGDVVGQWVVQGALAICNGCEVRRICWKDAEKMKRTVLHLAEAADHGKRVKPIDPIDENCRHFSDLRGSVLLSYRQAVAQRTLCRRVKEQSGLVEKQFYGAGEALRSRARTIRERDRENAAQRERIFARLTEAGMIADSIDLYDTDGFTNLEVVLRRPLYQRREEVLWEIEHACGYRLRCVQCSVRTRSVQFRFEQDSTIHASMQVYRASAGQTVSGDAAGECRMFGGRVCYALSDGMGRGTKAREESESALEMLFSLYRAGMQKDLIYDNVNRMLMANGDDEMYATLDAVSIDLNTGEAEILKYGAPPSFLLRSGSIRMISGEALPCGILEEAKPSLIQLQLQPSDRLVLCSDGVQDALPEGTENALKNLADSSDAPMGEVLLKLAESRGGSDDMTVMVIQVA